jgi:hypothetical protein
VGFPAILLLWLGVVQVVTGVRCGELLKLAKDPTLGWREFGAFLFLVASFAGATAAFCVLGLMCQRLLGL